MGYSFGKIQVTGYGGRMDIDLILKIAAIGILVAILNQVLIKSGKEDIATIVSIAGLVIVLLMVVDLLGVLFESLRRIFGLY